MATSVCHPASLIVVRNGARIGRPVRRIGVTVRIRPEDLPDLEDVISLPAIKRHDGAVIVDVEFVVAFPGIDTQSAVDRLVIIDAFHFEMELAWRVL